MKQQLAALRAREDQLRKDLDTSSTVYLKLFRDPSISRANDDMLREKQRSNELWNELEALIHDRNEITHAYTRLESTNLCIIQNLYQTQVLLQTQQEKQRQHGLYGMDMTEEDAQQQEDEQGKAGGKGRNTGAAAILGSALPVANDSTSSSGPPLEEISPLDAGVLAEVTKLNQLRSGEIALQKKLSKFLGLREQVQTYLIKIAGFQKKLMHQQAQQQQQQQQGALDSHRRNGSGQASPRKSHSSSASSLQSHSLLKKSSSKDNVPSAAVSSQPIPITATATSPSALQQRRGSGSGVNSVFSPFTPESPGGIGSVPVLNGAGGGGSGGATAAGSVEGSSSSSASSSSSSTPSTSQPPHQLLVKPQAARSVSPSPAAGAPAAAPPAQNLLKSSRAASASTPTTSVAPSPSASPAPQQISTAHKQRPQQHPHPYAHLSPAALAERQSIEASQLANLIFDARNRKVLQRICEQFQRSGLLSSRRYKKNSHLIIHQAFLGVELLTWVLNIGISSNRMDALILLELLLRAGLIDMIQDTDAASGVGGNKKKSSAQSSLSPSNKIAIPGSDPSPSSTTVSSGSAPTRISGTLRISDRTLFGDMKLQFALYRLRGDSSELTKLSKSGWLHRVSRWRVARKYFIWDRSATQTAYGLGAKS